MHENRVPFEIHQKTTEITVTDMHIIARHPDMMFDETFKRHSNRHIEYNAGPGSIVLNGRSLLWSTSHRQLGNSPRFVEDSWTLEQYQYPDSMAKPGEPSKINRDIYPFDLPLPPVKSNGLLQLPIAPVLAIISVHVGPMKKMPIDRPVYRLPEWVTWKNMPSFLQ